MNNTENRWKAWIAGICWIRGVTAAMALAALVPNFVDLSRYQFLRVAYATIIGWNSLAESIGRYAGEIPFLPVVSADLINTILITTTLFVPVAFWYVKKILKEYKNPRPRNSNYSIFFLFILFTPLGYYEVKTMQYENYWGIETLHYYILLVIFIASFVLTLRSFPGYRRGLISLIGFIATLQILYLLNAPIIGKHINEFSCGILKISPDKCVS
jgi:hypothetical protein